MEHVHNSSANMYEVEKIINCKIYHNKKYYLIKWLYYPINQSTWEPKSNLKHLNALINVFEAEYPYSVDQKMYNIFCEEVNKKRKIKKKLKKSASNKKLLSNKRKIEYFSELELNDHYLDKLKSHLYIYTNEKQKDYIKQSSDDLIIDLSSAPTEIDEGIKDNSLIEQNLNIAEEKKDLPKLRMPKMF